MILHPGDADKSDSISFPELESWWEATCVTNAAQAGGEADSFTQQEEDKQTLARMKAIMAELVCGNGEGEGVDGVETSLSMLSVGEMDDLGLEMLLVEVLAEDPQWRSAEDPTEADIVRWVNARQQRVTQ